MEKNIKENNMVNIIWNVADLLRGDFKQSEYGKIILPFIVLRRFDCVLKPTKSDVLKMNETIDVENKAPIFKKITGHDFYNISNYDFEKLIDDSSSINSNLNDYLNGFSENVSEIFDSFELRTTIDRLDKNNLLFLIVEKFNSFDFGVDTVNNLTMGYVFEELIRKFSEQSNETAGEHFTPREVIELMVEIILEPDMAEITKPGKVVTIFDPACGTGGMLSIAQNKIVEINNDTTVIPFGQELNPETYATCKSDMILKGNTNSKIVLGNSLSEDGFKNEKYDYMLTNPPFGVDWKKVEKFVKNEEESLGFGGRFGAGTPRISDGQLLFLQHMISKMRPKELGGSRIGVVFNGSPLFTGDAGSGESEIRKWIIENDMLEAIIALPTELFYNTGIATYIWVITNKKSDSRKGKVRLVNGVNYFEKIRKALGNKRNEISEVNREEIVKLYSMKEQHEDYKEFNNEEFGYNKVVVERPLKYIYKVNESKIDEITNKTKKSKELFLGKNDEFEEQYNTFRNNLANSASDKEFKTSTEFIEYIETLTSSDYKLDKNRQKTLLSIFCEENENGEIIKDGKGNIKPSSQLRDTENIPLNENIEEYITREVLPFVPEAWIDESKTKVGYEIPFTKHFYKFKMPRKTEEIISEIMDIESELFGNLEKIFKDKV